jgi:WD40 repeat protein
MVHALAAAISAWRRKRPAGLGPAHGVFLVAAGVALVFAVRLALRPDASSSWREIVSLVPVDAHRAIVVERSSEGRIRVSSVDGSRGYLWSRVLDRSGSAPRVTASSGSPVVVLDGALALGVADGRVLWQRPHPVDSSSTFHVRGNVLLEWGPSSLSGADATTGEERWRIAVPSDPEARLLFIGDTIVLRGRTPAIVDLRTGKARDLEGRVPIAVCPAESSVLLGTKRQDDVYRLDLATGSATALGGDSFYHPSYGCTTYRGRTILSSDQELVAYHHETFDRTWQLSLRTPLNAAAEGACERDSTNVHRLFCYVLHGNVAKDARGEILDGWESEPPRFVPVLDGPDLFVVDLDRYAVVSRLGGASFQSVESHAGVSYVRWRDHIGVLDGARGTFVASLDLRAGAGERQVSFEPGGERVWVHDALGLGQLDARTLAPLPGSERFAEGRVEGPPAEPVPVTVPPTGEELEEARTRGQPRVEAEPASNRPAGTVEAHRAARRLYAQAMLDPDAKKARALFLEAADALPPGGAALQQAGRMAALDGDRDTAKGLYTRAFAALVQSTGLTPRLSIRRPPSGDPERLAADARGRFLLSTGRDLAALYDTTDLRPRFEHDASSQAAALSRDGAVVVLASGSHLLSCSLVEAACAGVVPPSRVLGLALSADGETLATYGRDGIVDVRDAATLAVRSTHRLSQGKGTAVAVSPAGDRIFVGTSEGAVLRVRADTGQIEGERRGHRSDIVALALDDSGSLLASADAHVVRVGKPEDAEGEAVVRRTKRGDCLVSKLELGPDARTLFIEQDEEHCSTVLDVWSVATRALQTTKVPEQPDLRSSGNRVAIAEDRLFVVGHGFSPWGTQTGVAEYQVSEAGSPRFDEPALRARVFHEAFGGPRTGLFVSGSTLAVLGDTRMMTPPVWDTARGVFLGYPSLHGRRAPLPPRMPPDAVDGVAAGGTLAWIDRERGVHVGPRAGPFLEIGSVNDFSFWDPDLPVTLSPTGSRVAFRSRDSTSSWEQKRAEIWDVRGDRPPFVLERAGIVDIVFGSDGTAFLSALDGTITVVRGGTARTLFLPDGATPSALALLRDGRFLAAAAAGGEDTTLFIFSVADGALRATLRAHGKGALVTTPAGLAEVFGPIEDEVVCSFGPFVLDLALCRDGLLRPGLLARILDGRPIEP